MAFPLPWTEVLHAWDSACKASPDTAKGILDFEIQPEPLQATDGASLLRGTPRAREWVLEWQMARRFLSLLVAPGGTGKSLLGLAFAALIVTGKPLAGYEVKKQGPVWYANLEDGVDEIHLRLSGLRNAFDLDPAGLQDLLISGREKPFLLATRTSKGEIRVNKAWMEKTIAWAKEVGLVAMILDPLVLMHNLAENSNEEMGALLVFLSQLLERTGVAVLIVHHSRKLYASDQVAGNQEVGRGASALAAGARIVSTLTTMSAADAERLGINPELRSRYLRLDNAKSNLFLPPESAQWYEKVSVSVPAVDAEGNPVLESIGALKPWEARREAQDRVDPEVKGALLRVLERLCDGLREDSGEEVFSLRGLTQAILLDPEGPTILSSQSESRNRTFLRQVLSVLQRENFGPLEGRVSVSLRAGRGGNMEWSIALRKRQEKED
jgi:hypothetical protein